jgi:SAM-dependent methyltransferase
MDEIGRYLGVGPQTCVLDYGCGLGRISKALIEKHGCRAIGVDTSRAMRLLAPEYVLSERFVVWSPETLDKMIAKGFRADCCVSLWVIQHAFDPLDVIGRMSRAVRPGGLLYVLNTVNRCVPTDVGMVDDGFDIGGALRQAFAEEHSHPLPESVTTAHLAATTRIQVLRKSP